MKDKIVENIIAQFSKRSEVGIKKYGTTLEENNNDDFLQHLKEELMDAVLYIEKLQSLNKLKDVTGQIYFFKHVLSEKDFMLKIIKIYENMNLKNYKYNIE